MGLSRCEFRGGAGFFVRSASSYAFLRYLFLGQWKAIAEACYIYGLNLFFVFGCFCPFFVFVLKRYNTTVILRRNNPRAERKKRNLLFASFS